MIRKNI